MQTDVSGCFIFVSNKIEDQIRQIQILKFYQRIYSVTNLIA